MSDRNRPRFWLAPLLVSAVSIGLLALWLAGATRLSAGEEPKKPPEERRVATGTSLSPYGWLLHREGPGKRLQPVQIEASVFTRDLLLALPGTRAEFKTKNGSLGVGLWGNLPNLSNIPVLESAIVVHDNAKVDLDFTLDRGRIVVTNRKAKGAARLQVRVLGVKWQLNLTEPKATIAMELYGRWPRGMPFRPSPMPEEQPTADLVFLVLEGNVELKSGAQEFALRAPPGPALFHWDSEAGADSGPRRQDTRPSWADADAAEGPAAKSVRAMLGPVYTSLKNNEIDTALADLLAAADRDDNPRRARSIRRLAVYAFEAVDALPQLLEALDDAKHPEVRETAVEGLHHWIGRGVEQDQELYKFLTKRLKYPPGQAEIVMSLLHGFSDTELALPQTYEVLIAYLGHKKLPIRELGRWHLYRLAAIGRAIKYDPVGPEADRDKAVKEWKKLLMDGKLPPR